MHLTTEDSMKTKMKKYIFSFIIIIATYFILRLNYGIFTPYNYFTANYDISNGKYQILVLGMNLDRDRYLVEKKFANKYKFKFKYFGCNVTTELVNGSKYYNEVVKNYLKNKYGNKFWDNLYTQLPTPQSPSD